MGGGGGGGGGGASGVREELPGAVQKERQKRKAKKKGKKSCDPGTRSNQTGQ